MLIKKHKSGQATIVLIVVTMMTVLGVAVASSSQSRINLRDTVYSTQSVQALSCAEAGADRALVDSRVIADQALATTPVRLSSNDSPTPTYAVEGCDSYEANLNNYPVSSPGPVTILSIPEGSSQEFNITDFSSGTKEIRFKSNNPSMDAGMAVYVYSGTPEAPVVERSMVFCDAGGTNVAPVDFDVEDDTTTITLDGETTPTPGAACAYDVPIPADAVVIRVRPLYADTMFQIPDFQGSTGYRIDSTGIAGQIQRAVNVTRFYGQLSGAFDEAIVAGDSIEDL